MEHGFWHLKSSISNLRFQFCRILDSVFHPWLRDLFRRLRLRPLDVFAGAGVHLDEVADIDERGAVYLGPGF